MSEWVKIAETFGVLSIVLIFLGLALWRAAGWFASNVLAPLVQKYIELLDALILSIHKQGAAFDKMAERMEIHTDRVEIRTGKIVHPD